MKPIYKPDGRAKEYGEYAINIYTECNHGCTYCYARTMAARFGKPWTGDIKPRDGIVEATKKQIERENITDKLIHLCFTCDPYPADIDTSVTREIIKVIKDSGNHVQILTKGGDRAARDFDLLDENDWFGVTYSGLDFPNTIEPDSSNYSLEQLVKAERHGIKTWISCEPVFNPKMIYSVIKICDFIGMFKIGKLNYQPSDINWGEFGRECERLCKKYKRNYMIKEDLRREMESRPT